MLCLYTQNILYRKPLINISKINKLINNEIEILILILMKLDINLNLD